MLKAMVEVKSGDRWFCVVFRVRNSGRYYNFLLLQVCYFILHSSYSIYEEVESTHCLYDWAVLLILLAMYKRLFCYPNISAIFFCACVCFHRHTVYLLFHPHFKSSYGFVVVSPTSFSHVLCRSNAHSVACALTSSHWYLHLATSILTQSLSYAFCFASTGTTLLLALLVILLLLLLLLLSVLLVRKFPLLTLPQVVLFVLLVGVIIGSPT